MKKGMVVLIALVVFVGWIIVIQDENDEGSRRLQPVVSTDTVALSESSCLDAGGAWNPCGSACRTDPDAICIELCVEYCECESYIECPEGYRCADRVDDVGVCLPL